MDTLFEGMRGGDLEDLILPMISVDEYESKIDDDALVIAFYVSEMGAAEDLNRYLQRSPVELLDTEISPAPDAQGYYMVFVELLRNKMLAENITEILEEIAPLANIENWKMQVRGQDDLLPFDEDVIGKIAQPQDALAESVLDFLHPSDLTDASVREGVLTIAGGHERLNFDLLGFGPLEDVLRDQNLSESAMSMNLDHVASSHQLATLLGTGWEAVRLGKAIVVQHTSSELALVLSV